MRTTSLTSVLVAMALVAGSTRPLPSQSGLRPGVKVRIDVSASPRMTGVVQSVTPDSVVLYVEPSAIRFGIARSEIQSIQISHGRSASAGAKKGALWGAATFGGIATIIAFSLASDSAYKASTDGISPAVFAAVGIAEGAGIGALIGVFVKSEKWESVSVRPAVGVGPHGFKLGLQVR